MNDKPFSGFDYTVKNLQDFIVGLVPMVGDELDPGVSERIKKEIESVLTLVYDSGFNDGYDECYDAYA